MVLEGDVCKKEDVCWVVEMVVNVMGRFDIFVNGVVGNFFVVFEDFFFNGFKMGMVVWLKGMFWSEI